MHICKAHKANTQKPTLQKSLPCSHAFRTPPAKVDTYSKYEVSRQRLNIQQKVYRKAGRRKNNHQLYYYRIPPSNPCLVELSSHLFLKKKYDKASFTLKDGEDY